MSEHAKGLGNLKMHPDKNQIWTIKPFLKKVFRGLFCGALLGEYGFHPKLCLFRQIKYHFEPLFTHL